MPIHDLEASQLSQNVPTIFDIRCISLEGRRRSTTITKRPKLKSQNVPTYNLKTVKVKLSQNVPTIWCRELQKVMKFRENVNSCDTATILCPRCFRDWFRIQSTSQAGLTSFIPGKNGPDMQLKNIPATWHSGNSVTSWFPSHIQPRNREPSVQQGYTGLARLYHDASASAISHCRGWHHGFHYRLSSSNPTLLKFLDALKAEHIIILSIVQCTLWIICSLQSVIILKRNSEISPIRKIIRFGQECAIILSKFD